MLVRRERASDIERVWEVNYAAFGTDEEADLVDRLRERCEYISLVAEVGGEVVGHILFTPVTLVKKGEDMGAAGGKFMGLAPMAVHPGHQRSGVGSVLVEEGLKECKRGGCGAVFVLGHPGYYPRFGFVPASEYGVRSEYKVRV